MAYSTYTKLKKCIQCPSQFKGTIDSTGKFCSIRCKLKYLETNPLPEATPKPQQKEKPIPSKPFNCTKCGVTVYQTWTKAHRKGLCILNCDGIKRDAGGYPLNPELRKGHIQVKKSHLKRVHRIRKAEKEKLSRKEKIRSSLQKKKIQIKKPSFYESREWQELRYKVLKQYGRKCMLCHETTGIMHVDHIKPRSKYPHLELEITNLQVLCKPCNLGKSNLDETDWRNLK